MIYSWASTIQYKRKDTKVFQQGPGEVTIDRCDRSARELHYPQSHADFIIVLINDVAKQRASERPSVSIPRGGL